MVFQSFVTQHMGTNITMGLLYLILSLLLNDEVHAVFEVHNYQDSFTWQTALYHCDKIGRNLTIAVPVVNLSSMTVLDKIDLQGEAWVGYFQRYEHFLFIVCVPLSALESLVSATFNIGGDKNRPGLCYSFCGLQGYIGLLGDRCYCIETRTFPTQYMQSVNSSCDKPLHCANGMLCGNHGSSKISVYKMVTIASTSSNDMRGKKSGCMIVTREYKMLLAKCEDRFRHLCEFYTGQTLNLVESPTIDQWVYSIQDCTQTGQNPTTFIGNGTNFVFPNSSGPWWTSVVRDLVMRNCSGSMTIQGTTVYEGFLKNSNEGIKLEFVHAGINSKKMSLACMSGEQPSNEQENRTSERAETTISSAPSEEPILIPDKRMRISSTSQLSTDKLIPGCHSEPTDVNIIYGLAALSALLFGALVITALVCVFRRRQVSQESVNVSAIHSTREQHTVLERQVTNRPSNPSRHTQKENDNLESAYLTVIFDGGREDVAIQ